MIAEVTTAALMSENKHLANPCSTDSTPTSANQEDHVSMAAHGARRLTRMNGRTSPAHHRRRTAVRRSQGVEFRAPLATSPAAAARNRSAALRAEVAHARPPTGRMSGRYRRSAAALVGGGAVGAGAMRGSRPLLGGGGRSVSRRSRSSAANSGRWCWAMPHSLGAHAPAWDAVARLTRDSAGRLADTDWHDRPRSMTGLLDDVDHREGGLPPLCHRRQPRSLGCKPLSRPEHHRASAR
jgi:hypothetical protein